jgi:hypothetical protein
MSLHERESSRDYCHKNLLPWGLGHMARVEFRVYPAEAKRWRLDLVIESLVITIDKSYQSESMASYAAGRLQDRLAHARIVVSRKSPTESNGRSRADRSTSTRHPRAASVPPKKKKAPDIPTSARIKPTRVAR